MDTRKSTKEKIMYDVLPEGYSLQKTPRNRTVIKYGDHLYVVASFSGYRKWFKGVDEETKRKAIHWTNKFVNGDYPNYDVR
jgi:hypothetical protein